MAGLDLAVFWSGQRITGSRPVMTIERLRGGPTLLRRRYFFASAMMQSSSHIIVTPLSAV